MKKHNKHDFTYHLQYIDGSGNILAKEIFTVLKDAIMYGKNALKENEKVESFIVYDFNNNELYYKEKGGRKNGRSYKNKNI